MPNDSIEVLQDRDRNRDLFFVAKEKFLHLLAALSEVRR